MNPNIRPVNPSSTPSGSETLVRANSRILVDTKDGAPIAEPFHKVAAQLRNTPNITDIAITTVLDAYTVTVVGAAAYTIGDVIISANISGGSGTIVSFAGAVLTLDRPAVVAATGAAAIIERLQVTALSPTELALGTGTSVNASAALTLAVSVNADELAARAAISFGTRIAHASVPADTYVIGYNATTRVITLSANATGATTGAVTAWDGVLSATSEVRVVETPTPYAADKGLIIFIDDTDVASPVKVSYNGNIYNLALVP